MSRPQAARAPAGPGRPAGAVLGRLVVGAGGIVLALGYAALTLATLSLGRRGQPGAALFPLIVAVLLAGTGGMLVLETWRRRGACDRQVPLPTGADRRRLLAVAAAVVAYVGALPWLGFLVASALFASVALSILTGRVGPSPVLLGLALAVATDVVFVHLLGVPLPRGVLP